MTKKPSFPNTIILNLFWMMGKDLFFLMLGNLAQWILLLKGNSICIEVWLNLDLKLMIPTNLPFSICRKFVKIKTVLSKRWSWIKRLFVVLAIFMLIKSFLFVGFIQNRHPNVFLWNVYKTSCSKASIS